MVLAQISFFALFRLCMCYQTSESASTASLSPHEFYDNSFPKAQAIVQSIVAKAHSDQTLNQTYASMLQQRCPISGDDQNLFNLDYETPTKFDNYYFKNLVNFRRLLNSDEILFTQSSETMEMVKLNAENEEVFFEQFANSILKMGNVSPLTGMNGEIRKICRRVNHMVA